MGIDYTALLLDPVYTLQGVDVTIAFDSGETFTGLTGLDKTEGIDVGDNIEIPTIRPVAAFRIVELKEAGIDPELCEGALLTINGFQWRITNHKFAPTPGGENDGEIYFILSDKEASSSS